MSRRRLVLLYLLVIPAILFCLTLIYPGAGDEQNGFEFVSLIIAIPIIFLNAWEWQQPESLDNLINSDIFSSVPSDLKKTKIAGKVILIVAAGLIFIFLGVGVFGSLRQVPGSSSGRYSEVLLNIGEIQTAAVMTALAEREVKPGNGSPIVSSVTITKNPLTSLEPALSETIEPGILAPTSLTQSTLELEASSEPSSSPTIKNGTHVPNPNLTVTSNVANTPQKTRTPEPTEPVLPDPVFLTGDGDDVVDFDKWKGPAILSATHDGDGNFVVTSFEANKQKIAVLVNTTGNYQGTLPLDFLTGETATRFEVKATGLWDLQIFPIEQGRIESIPATIEGYGDDVVIFSDAFPDQLKIDATDASQSFVIWAFSNGTRSQLINQNAPFSGIVTCPPGITSISITANGPWLIEITTK